MEYSNETSLIDSINIIDEKVVSLVEGNILIRWVKGLPESIKGLCSKRSDLLYWIVINADLSREQQAETLQHEILHIKRNDFDSNKSVQEIEHEVHQQIEAWGQIKQIGA